MMMLYDGVLIREIGEKQ